MVPVPQTVGPCPIVCMHTRPTPPCIQLLQQVSKCILLVRRVLLPSYIPVGTLKVLRTALPCLQTLRSTSMAAALPAAPALLPPRPAAANYFRRAAVASLSYHAALRHTRSATSHRGPGRVLSCAVMPTLVSARKGSVANPDVRLERMGVQGPAGRAVQESRE